MRASYKWLGLVIFFIGCLATPAMAELDLNMREGVTSISNEVYGLHMTIFWVCVGIGIVVFGAMIWSMVYHRKSKGAVASQFHESTTMDSLDCSTNCHSGKHGDPSNKDTTSHGRYIQFGHDH